MTSANVEVKDFDGGVTISIHDGGQHTHLAYFNDGHIQVMADGNAYPPTTFTELFQALDIVRKIKDIYQWVTK